MLVLWTSFFSIWRLGLHWPLLASTCPCLWCSGSGLDGAVVCIKERCPLWAHSPTVQWEATGAFVWSKLNWNNKRIPSQAQDLEAEPGLHLSSHGPLPGCCWAALAPISVIAGLLQPIHLYPATSFSRRQLGRHCAERFYFVLWLKEYWYNTITIKNICSYRIKSIIVHNEIFCMIAQKRYSNKNNLIFFFNILT